MCASFTVPTTQSTCPFAADLCVEPQGDGRYTLTLHIDVLKGWHAYDAVPAGSPYKPLSFEFDLPDGVTQAGEWKKPPAQTSIETSELAIYAGSVAFSCELSAGALEASTEIACELSYQICDARMCMRPATTRLTSLIKP
jgi:DsbC/DsbD-like thiol-disulfide interchange protein